MVVQTPALLAVTTWVKDPSVTSTVAPASAVPRTITPPAALRSDRLTVLSDPLIGLLIVTSVIVSISSVSLTVAVLPCWSVAVTVMTRSYSPCGKVPASTSSVQVPPVTVAS